MTQTTVAVADPWRRHTSRPARKNTRSPVMEFGKVLQRIERTFGAACLALMFGIICFNVVLRYVFSEPLYWAEEASNWLFVWIGFLSCAYAVGDDSHIRVTLLVDLLPDASKRWITLFFDAVMIFVFGAFILPSWHTLFSLHISTGLRVHEGYAYAIVPLTMALCCIHLAIKLAHDARAVVAPCRS
jgi:TRAP-type C4-dicarboxylate transport system permease small subunit